MLNNVFKNKFSKGGILCFIVLLGASSVFATEQKQVYKGSYKGKTFTITKEQFFKYNRDLKQQLIKDGYSGLYGEDIYYKDNNFVKKLDNIFKENQRKHKDIFNKHVVNLSEYAITHIVGYSNREHNAVYQQFASDFFITTHDNKDFNDYFKTKKIKYPYNYALIPKFDSALVVKILNANYYLYKENSGQSFLIESKYINQESFNKNTTEWTDYKKDGSVVRIDKAIIRGTRDLSFQDEVGHFQTNTFIVEKDVLAEQNGGYKVFNYEGTLDLESNEGFLPILKPYRVKENLE